MISLRAPGLKALVDAIVSSGLHRAAAQGRLACVVCGSVFTGVHRFSSIERHVLHAHRDRSREILSRDDLFGLFERAALDELFRLNLPSPALPFPVFR